MSSIALIFALFAVVSAAAPPRSKHAEPKSATESDFEIPASAIDRKNPIAASEETLSAGRVLWRSHCETCHGPLGKGDGPNARLHEARKGYAAQPD